MTTDDPTPTPEPAAPAEPEFPSIHPPAGTPSVQILRALAARIERGPKPDPADAREILYGIRSTDLDKIHKKMLLDARIETDFGRLPDPGLLRAIAKVIEVPPAPGFGVLPPGSAEAVRLKMKAAAAASTSAAVTPIPPPIEVSIVEAEPSSPFSMPKPLGIAAPPLTREKYLEHVVVPRVEDEYEDTIDADYELVARAAEALEDQDSALAGELYELAARLQAKQEQLVVDSEPPELETRIIAIEACLMSLGQRVGTLENKK